ncbi:MAG: helix-turn-helix domain-containing protein [Clostridiales bacterium]|nr:helix-turn-helix domain-containing protein [Clostridiales bacterium]MDD7431861.1 helix-turn-helix transcriptional regulator [Clostridiales bacterium]MDY3062067.1 helix-turn-helix transcriptional regulator [Eubacteriales bacterium]
MDHTNKQDAIRFKEFLKIERLRNSMTQTDLACLMSVSRQTVSSWEKGTRIPDVFTLEALAEVLHTSVYQLLAGKEKEESEQAENMPVSSEVVRQLTLLNSHYAELIWRKDRKWKTTWIILCFLGAIIILTLIVHLYIFHFQSGTNIEIKPLQEENIILTDE